MSTESRACHRECVGTEGQHRPRVTRPTCDVIHIPNSVDAESSGNGQARFNEILHHHLQHWCPGLRLLASGRESTPRGSHTSAPVARGCAPRSRCSVEPPAEEVQSFIVEPLVGQREATLPIDTRHGPLRHDPQRLVELQTSTDHAPVQQCRDAPAPATLPIVLALPLPYFPHGRHESRPTTRYCAAGVWN